MRVDNFHAYLMSSWHRRMAFGCVNNDQAHNKNLWLLRIWPSSDLDPPILYTARIVTTSDNTIPSSKSELIQLLCWSEATTMMSEVAKSSESSLLAINFQFTHFHIQNRREEVDVVKIGLGKCDSVYRRVPADSDSFSLLSLFSIEKEEMEDVWDGVLQVEFYSERQQGLVLVCAAVVDHCVFEKQPAATAKSPYIATQRLLRPIASCSHSMPLFYWTQQVFSISAGCVDLLVEIFLVQKELAARENCSLCKLSNNPLPAPVEPSVALPPPPPPSPPILPVIERTRRYSGDSTSDDEDEGDDDDETDDSLDDFVQRWLVRNEVRDKTPAPRPLPSVAIETKAEDSYDTKFNISVEASSSIAPKPGRSHHSRILIKQKAKGLPHYMLPARQPTFAESLRKR
eukprot:scaffold3290_cov165-Ochromonas_danica.AAC.9